ncbi:MAG: DUF106 domain-containing protein [Candidatus Aenigmarchaeota archaeon]|nr:DUF106 domain-containing protein [Candidatus Aenigmarchaeota archaeon]
MFESVLNTIFSPVVGLNPLAGIFIISSIITGILTLINKKVMGSTNAKEVKQKMEKARADMLEAQKTGEKKDIDKHMKKMMEINSEYLQSMIKPMTISLVISMLLVILFFPWMKAVYNGMTILVIPSAIPLIGGKGLTWLIWYIICSIAISLILRKVLRM